MSPSSSAAVRVVQSASAATRLHHARQFVDQFAPGDEVLLLGASRGSVDDFARAIALQKGGTFGLHRLSFTQLAARLAAADLAARGHAPASTLGYEAIAARSSFEATRDETLDYFAAVSSTPGFPKALARTLNELRLAGVLGPSLERLKPNGRDLAELLERVETLMDEAGSSDRALLFETASRAIGSQSSDLTPGLVELPTLLLDVPIDSHAEARFLGALIERA